MVELNRRLVKGYTTYKDDPRIIHLKKSVNQYNQQLRLLNLRDHQVEYARFSIGKVIATLVYRLGKLAILAIGTLPGLVLFAPVFVAAKVISIKKSREALAASTVKIQGRDVMATWKLLVALAFAPILYAFYGTFFAWLAYRNRIWGVVPDWVPLWLFVMAEIVLFPSITFAAFRFGEVGMDIFKSLRPLVLSLNPTSANTLVRLRAKRETLSIEVTQLINTLGPEMFPDFDSTRIIGDPLREGALVPSSPTRFTSRDINPHEDNIPPDSPSAANNNNNNYQAAAPAASIGGGSSAQGHMPRNESFANLSSIALFATRPPSRNRSRSRSSSSAGGGGGAAGAAAAAAAAGLPPMQAFSTLDSTKDGLDEVSKRIRGAMKERASRRRRSEDMAGFVGAVRAEEMTGSSSGAVTPSSTSASASASEEWKKDV